MRLLDEKGSPIAAVTPKQPINLELDLVPQDVRGDFRFGISLATLDGVRLFTVHREVKRAEIELMRAFTLRSKIENNLRPGSYLVDIGAHATNGAWWFSIPKSMRLDVENIIDDPYNMGVMSAAAEWTFADTSRDSI